MPDFVQLKNSENRIKDVGNIENCVLRLVTAREQKHHSLLFHILHAVLAALIGYISMDGSAVGASPLVCLVCMFIFPAFYAYAVLYSPGYLKAVCTFSPFILFCLRSTFSPLAGEGPLTFAITATGFLMCLSIGGIMAVTVLKKKTKLWCLIAVTACIAVCLAAAFMFAVTYIYGEFDTTNLVSDLNESIEALGMQVRSLLIKEFSNPGTLEMYKTAFPELSDKSISEIALTLSDTFVEAAKLLKNTLPAIIILVCMFYSFIFVGIFSVTARIHRIPLYICIMDNRWCYRIPQSCITFFDIVLLFAIIDTFIALPQNISLAILNLLIILVPVVTICTFKAIHFFLYRKLHSKAAAYAICGAVGVISILFLGLWGYLFLCSIGVTFVTQRYRMEGEIAKIKIVNDIELMLIICGCKEPKSFYSVCDSPYGFNTPQSGHGINITDFGSSANDSPSTRDTTDLTDSTDTTDSINPNDSTDSSDLSETDGNRQ